MRGSAMRGSQAVRCCGARAARPSMRCAAAATEAPARLSAADRVQLGDSALHVSVCCLGTMTWGVQNTEEDAHAQLNYAWDSNINFLDTAEMYPIPTSAETQGRTDRYIGSWLKYRKRDEVVLATKVSGYSDRNTYLRNPPETTRVTKAQVVASVEASLHRLQTDYIDLLQVHWPDRYVGGLFGQPAYDIASERQGDIPFEEQLEGLDAVVKSGKVRYVGVSNETSYGVSEFVHIAERFGLPKIQTIQNGYHLLSRGQFETDLAETCRRHNVSLLAYSPLAGGALTGKYLGGEPPKGARFTLFPGYMERYNKSLAREAAAEYAEIARKYGMTPTQLALAWCRSRWFVASTIIGATSVDHLKENIGAFELALPEEAVADINSLYRRRRDPPNSA